MTHIGFLIWLFFVYIFPTFLAQASPPHPIHHTLNVTIEPESHTLTATDLVRLPPTLLDQSPLSFTLNPHLTIDSIEINGQSLSISKISHNPSASLPYTEWVVEHSFPQRADTNSTPLIKVSYHGQINESPEESRGLRFIRPDKTNGHIGPQGIYLSSETYWYPSWEHHMVTFDLTITLPSDWQAITQGEELNQSVTTKNQTSHWSITPPTEALTLAANHFVVQKRPWRNIQLATYLFPEEASLASQYLDATAAYLELYTTLLGPYPFTQFAVAENFFPSGLGMPSFTLLGQGIVRRGYTQPYSLGHEIVHSWLGNSVFNNFSEGNWVEGLTTYLANYYYDEATGDHTAATKPVAA